MTGVLNVCTLGNGTVGKITDGTSFLILLSNSGTPLVHGGASISLDRIVYHSALSTNTVNVSAGNYGTTDILEFFTWDNSDVFNIQGDITVAGTFYPVANPGVTGVTINTQNHSLTVADITFGDSGANGSTILNLGSSIVDIGANGLVVAVDGGTHALNLGSATITSEGDWQLTSGTGNITQIEGTSSVTIDASLGTVDILSAGQAFNNLEIDAYPKGFSTSDLILLAPL